MARAIGYYVIQYNGYKDTANEWTYCKTRYDVECQLVDYGWMDNPGVQVFKMVKGDTPELVIKALITADDPYPDYVVERGPRGGIQWNKA